MPLSNPFGKEIFRAKVAVPGTNEATIIPLGASAATQRPYKYALDGMQLSAGDDVYVIPISGTYVLLGGAVAGGVTPEELEAALASRAKTDELGIVVNGNTAALGASAGQYIILSNSTISGKADGVYTAKKAIPANTAIDGSYLDGPVSAGGLNDLQQKQKSSNVVALHTGSDGDIFYQKVGNVVYVTGGNFASNTLEHIFPEALPSGMRPKNRVLVQAINTNSASWQLAYVVINTDGTIDFVNKTGGAVSGLYLYTSYPV